MAREVYFDPFGSFTEGYDKGTAREMQVQRETRAARAEDFDYNYLTPLKYRSAQRDDSLGEYALPYRKNAVRYEDQIGQNNVYTGNQAIAKDFGMQTGVTAPWESEAYSRFKIDPRGQAGADPKRIQQIIRAQATYDAGMKHLKDLPPNATEIEVRAQDAHMAQLKKDIAEMYGLNPDEVTNPLPSGVEYWQQGPNGPTRVGGMADPRTQLLENWNRSETIAEAARQHGYQNEVDDRAYKQNYLRYLQSTQTGKTTLDNEY